MKKFPDINKIPLIGKTSPASFSIEKTIALHPDVVLFSVISGHAPGVDSEEAKTLEESGIPVIFVDFRTNPAANTIPSIRILGQALNRQKEAEEYINFYKGQMHLVTDVTSKIVDSKKKSVFLELVAGLTPDCCKSIGNGNFSDFISLAGGKNIAESSIPGTMGTINMEKIIKADPDICIATGSRPASENKAVLNLGALTTRNEASSSLKNLLKRNGFDALSCVKKGRMYGIWHGYYNSPYNIIAVQRFAKWFYPEKFKNLNPENTLKLLHEKFLPVPFTGNYWISVSGKETE